MSHYNSVIPLTSDRLGNYDRVKTDEASTSFFEGREFLVAHPFTIAPGQSHVVKFVTLRNLVVQTFQLSIDEGNVRFLRKTGGVEGGSFSENILISACNNMTGVSNRRLYDGLPFVTNSVLSMGGTLTGGDEFDQITLKSPGATAQAVTVGTSSSDHIGVPPGTRYYVFDNIGNNAVTGTFRVRWEERPD